MKKTTKNESWLDGLIKQAQLKPPKDAISVDNFCAKTGYSYPQARRILEEGVKSGKLKCDKFKVENGILKFYWDA